MGFSLSLGLGSTSATTSAPSAPEQAGATSAVIAAGGATQDVTIPGTPQENDIVLVHFACDSALFTSSVPTGYTEILANGASTPGSVSAYKRMGATPDTVVAVPQNASLPMPCIVETWRNIDTTTALDATATVANDAADGNPNPPSITTVTDGAIVVAVGFLDDDDDAANITAPAGYSGLVSEESGAAPAGATVMSAYKAIATAGGEDPAAFGGVAVDSWYGLSIALRPVA